METYIIPLALCVQSEINMKFIIIVFSPFEIREMCNIPCFGFVEKLVLLYLSHTSSARRSTFNTLLRLSHIRVKVKREAVVDGKLCAVFKCLLVADATHGRNCNVGAVNNGLPSFPRPRDSDNTLHLGFVVPCIFKYSVKHPTRCTINLIFIALSRRHRPTCFGHYCAHHQEPLPTAFAATGYRMIAGLGVFQVVVGLLVRLQ
jgi:hypothetical protein